MWTRGGGSVNAGYGAGGRAPARTIAATSMGIFMNVSHGV
jgi:hypothetical protein